jgi:hypothetical protein
MSSTNDPAADQGQQPMAPPSVTFTVLCTVPYDNQTLVVQEGSHQVHAQLQDGTHTFVSGDIRLGVVHSSEDKTLLGRISFAYTFNAKQSSVIVCGTDFGSADGMRLVTTLEGTEHSCTARAVAAGFLEDDVSPTRGWDFRTPMTPGADAVFKSMARSASDSLIVALQSVRGLAVLQRTSLPDLSQEEWSEMGIVVRHDGMLDMYNPPADGNLRGPLGSTVRPGGIINLTAGENFANVIDSTGDPYPEGHNSWVKLWACMVNHGVLPTTCSSFHYNGFECNKRIIGGHVIRGTTASKVDHKLSKVAFIMPICDRHNKPHHNDKAIAAIEYTTGVWLFDYFQKDE